MFKKWQHYVGLNITNENYLNIYVGRYDQCTQYKKQNINCCLEKFDLNIKDINNSKVKGQKNILLEHYKKSEGLQLLIEKVN